MLSAVAAYLSLLKLHFYRKLLIVHILQSEKTDPDTNLTTVEFTETVKMSSYLAVFIVCDFEKQARSVNMTSGQPVNVYARKEQINNVEEALKVAENVVNFYAGYFNVPYPMPKIGV